MKAYLIVGGIGAGKSSVAALLAKRGACVFDLDVIGHDVLEDVAVRQMVRDAFGPSVIDNDGRISREALAGVVFASEEGVGTLNSITHPVILDRLLQCIEQKDAMGCRIVAIEASAYRGPSSLTEPLASLFDGVVAVIASQDTRIARARDRGMALETVRERVLRQPSDEQFRTWADYVIENDGEIQDLEESVDRLMSWMLGR